MNDLKKEDWPRIYFRTLLAEDVKNVTKFWGGYQNVYELFTDWFMSLTHEERSAFLSAIREPKQAGKSLKSLLKIPGLSTGGQLEKNIAASTKKPDGYGDNEGPKTRKRK